MGTQRKPIENGVEDTASGEVGDIDLGGIIAGGIVQSVDARGQPKNRSTLLRECARGPRPKKGTTIR